MESVALEIFKSMDNLAFLKGFIVGGVVGALATYFFLGLNLWRENRLQRQELMQQKQDYEELLRKQKENYEREISKIIINDSAKYYKP